MLLHCIVGLLVICIMCEFLCFNNQGVLRSQNQVRRDRGREMPLEAKRDKKRLPLKQVTSMSLSLYVWEGYIGCYSPHFSLCIHIFFTLSLHTMYNNGVFPLGRDYIII